MISSPPINSLLGIAEISPGPDTHAPNTHYRDVKTTAAALLLPWSVMLPLLEFIPLEDDDEVLHFTAVTMSKCTLMSL